MIVLAILVLLGIGIAFATRLERWRPQAVLWSFAPPHKITRTRALQALDLNAGWALMKEVANYRHRPLFRDVFDDSFDSTNRFSDALHILTKLVEKKHLVIEDEFGTDVSRWPIELLQIDDPTARYAAYFAYQEALL